MDVEQRALTSEVTLPPHTLACPYVTLVPFRLSSPGAEPGTPYRTWRSVASKFAKWSDLLAGEATWEALMQGHPGHPGGGAIVPSGSGLAWGGVLDGVEFWLGDAEGLDDSPAWEASLAESATIDGSMLGRVTAKGREIRLSGFLAADSREALARGKVALSSVLSAVPRTGVLTYQRRRLPVAMAGPIRTRHVGTTTIEAEMSLVGIDLGRDWPGGGVFFQGASRIYSLSATTNLVAFAAGGSVPTPPRIEIAGPAFAGAYIEVSDQESRVTLTLMRDIAAGHRLDIDTRTRSVIAIDGLGNRTPDYGAVKADAWPLIGVRGGELLYEAQGASGGIVTVTSTELY